MSLVLTLFFLVVSVSFVCSLVEAAFIATQQSFIVLALKENRPYAKILEHLKDNVNKPITAIITLNTLVNTLGSAGIATLTLNELGPLGATLITITLTVTLLVFSEIVPKILGAIYWRPLAPFTAYTIQIMILSLYLIVWISEYLAKKAGVPEDTGTLTREEMIASAELSAEDGEIRKQESKIIKNLLTLNNLYVSDIMTPRPVIFALEANLKVGEVHQKYKPLRFSRIPVYEGSLDNIIGVTMRYQIHECVSMDHDDVTIKDIAAPHIQVSEKMTVSGLLEFLIKKKTHLAIVVDEYGVVTGLVTLEDAIETLLGVEIVDELDQVTDMRQYALEQWQIRKNQARLP